MEPDFLDMMPYVFVRIPYIRTDFHGSHVYDVDNPLTYRCRIVGKGLALRRREGEEDAIIVDIYADMGEDIMRTEDMIELPPSQMWIDQTPVIFSIGRFPDTLGNHHTKIQCGWMYHRQGQ